STATGDDCDLAVEQSRHHDGSSGGTGTAIDGDSVPPSTWTPLPVTHDDAGVAKYSAAHAMSSGVPGRCIGVFASNCARNVSSGSTTSSDCVATPPTEIAFTRTRGATSDASVRVIMFNAAFAALYATKPVCTMSL